MSIRPASVSAVNYPWRQLVATIAIVAGSGLLPPLSEGATLTIVPITVFGKPVAGCRLVEINTLSNERERMIVEPQANGHLEAKNIPLGEYQIRLSCGPREIQQTVRVDSEASVVHAVESARIMISHGSKATLIVTSLGGANAAKPATISLHGIYAPAETVSSFQGNRAGVVDPEPGLYFVTLQSPRGFVCGHLVAVSEFTRTWTFDPDGCRLQVDKFSQVLGNENPLGDLDSWLERMQQDVDHLWRSLQDSAIHEDGR